MITICLTLMSLVVCFGAAYWLVGWALAFLVVSQEALLSFGALVILACVAMAIVSHGPGANRWWGGMVIGIIALVALEMLEPYVGVVRIVLAVFAAIWSTNLLYHNFFRRLANNHHS